MNVTSQSIAQDLLKIGAVFLQPNNPFTWTSGIKSPIYCDNRLILSEPSARDSVEWGLSEIVRKEFKNAEILAGTATAGIPHAAFMAGILNLPMCYVRGAAKGHGRQNQIEGRVKEGQKVVVIEDLISTGGSVIEAAESLRIAGCNVLGVISIFTYNLQQAKKNFEEHNLRYVSLCSYDTLIVEAVKTGYISAKDLNKLKAFQSNPQDESWMEIK